MIPQYAPGKEQLALHTKHKHTVGRWQLNSSFRSTTMQANEVTTDQVFGHTQH